MFGIIPSTIVAISLAQLMTSGSFDVVTEGFFALPISSQISLLSILFALVFLAVGISQFLDPDAHDHHDHDTPPPSIIEYPIDEIQNATTDRDKFLALYPQLKQELTDHLKTKHELNDEALQWVEEMMDYTVPGGKLNRGITVLNVHRTLSAPNELTPTQIAKASVLGWAIEFLQAFFLVADDVMDSSETRRGQPCWYKNSNVGVIAINDSFLLESFVFTILEKHFENESYGTKLVNLFLQTIQQTEVGQLLDLTSQEMNDGAVIVDLKRFTLDRYKSIVKYKTAYYTFYLPVAIGMITSGVVEKEAFELAERICCKMGEYFQVQDDYLDCFGDPETIGKVGTDIQDNKCSWLVVQALDRVTTAQRVVLEKNYGQHDENKVQRIKRLYKDLDLPKVFEAYEEESYKSIIEDLDKVTLMPRDVFEILLKKIYKRSK